MISRCSSLVAALLLCAGCGNEAGAPSAEQNRDMDQAAEMLNKAPDSLSNIDDAGLERDIETAANAQDGR